MKTYKEFFHELNQKFKFTLDAAADSANHMLPNYFTPKENGLKQSWKGNVVWCNPPFGTGIKDWINKAYQECITNKVTSAIMVPNSLKIDTIKFAGCTINTVDIGKLKFEGQYSFADDLQLIIFYPLITYS